MPVIRRTNEEWQKLLADQQASGQTQVAWCAAHGINYHTMIDRARRFRKQEKMSAGAFVADDKKEWVKVKTAVTSVSCATVSEVRIEIGVYRITTDSGFPSDKLASLCRELSRSC